MLYSFMNNLIKINMARNGKFIFGAMLGALFGLVFAPKKGSELRKELKHEIEKGGHGEKTLKKTATQMGQDIVETSKEVYQDPQVQKSIRHGKKEALKLAEQAKAKLQESGEEWVHIAKEKLMDGKKTVEKEAGKAIDTIKKAAKPVATKAPPKSTSPSKKATKRRPRKK